MHKLLVFVLPVLLFFAFALFGINDVPAEWFGDISNEHEYVMDVIEGRTLWQFALSAGPLQHTLLVPVVRTLGGSYLVYKLSSVILGLMGLVAIMGLGYVLGSRETAFWAGMAGAVSFWLLVWSRLGNSPQIMSPVLVAGSVALVVHGVRTGNYVLLFFGTAVSGLGLVSYPAVFVLPAVAFAAVWIFARTKTVALWTYAVAGLVPGIWLFWRAYAAYPGEFAPGGYVGNKLAGVASVRDTLVVFGTNIVKNLAGLVGQGDTTFRINPEGYAHLDRITAAFAILGMITAWKRNRRFVWLCLVGLVIGVMPASFPGNPAVEIPSSGRTLGMLPWVLVSAGLGMTWIRSRIVRPAWAGWAVSIVLVAAIGGITWTRYFGIYARGLPAGNIPYSRFIASVVDQYPPDTPVYLASCCWAGQGVPEPKAIYYSLSRQAGRTGIYTRQFVRECADITDTHALVLSKPEDPLLFTLKRCFPGTVQTYVYEGTPLFSYFYK